MIPTGEESACESFLSHQTCRRTEKDQVVDQQANDKDKTKSSTSRNATNLIKSGCKQDDLQLISNQQSKQEEEEDDDEQEEDASTLFNGLSRRAQHLLLEGLHSSQPPEVRTTYDHRHHHFRHDGDEEDDDMEDYEEDLTQDICDDEEEEDEDYMRLDTIVEEEELSHSSSSLYDTCDCTNGKLPKQHGVPQSPHASSRDASLSQGAPPTSRVAIATNAGSNKPSHGVVDDDATPTPHGKQNNICDIKQTATSQSSIKSQTQQNSSKNRHQMHQSKQNDQQQQVPIPSTNRLISEHQARQQQAALFRVLAERQKVIDELADPHDGCVDLISASSLAASLGKDGLRRMKRRTTGSRQRAVDDTTTKDQSLADDATSGVPLSIVDLSSMTDRMLEDLICQAAYSSSSCSSAGSGGSSSTSQNGDDSSDLTSSGQSSSSSASDDDDESQNRTKHRTRKTKHRHSKLQPTSKSKRPPSDTPNVVGIHEDERIRSSSASTTFKCRDAHKKLYDRNDDRDSDNDDDDDNNDHELVVRITPNVAGGANYEPPCCDSLSPSSAAAQSRQQHRSVESYSDRSRLEQYFSSSLLNAHDLSSASEPISSTSDSLNQKTPSSSHKDQQRSVEGVLFKMIEALEDIGCDEQDKLNDLLEHGFAKLEQLLNCSLASAAAATSSPANSSQPLPNATQSNPQAVAAIVAGQRVAHSDYGSDTQSADCCSSQENSSHLTTADHKQSPSPTATVATGAIAAPANKLSPLAVELSFKLAESLQKLAQLQQVRRSQATSVAPEIDSTTAKSSSPELEPRAKTPMKSVVMINSTRSPSATSMVSQISSSPCNATPQSPRQQFKTCVSIGGSPSPSQLQISNVASIIEPTVASSSGGFERNRRSSRSRSSLRRIASLSKELTQDQTNGRSTPRPGSPIPKSSVQQHQPPNNNKSTGEKSSKQEQTTAMFAKAKSKNEAQVKQQQEQQVQRQQKLQKALVLAQKYNYSPAKLAASKLGSEFGLVASSHPPGTNIQWTTTGNFGFGVDSLDSEHYSTSSKRPKPIRVSGQIQLEISYFAKSGLLTVHVIQCAQLAPVSKRRNSSNPYVKLYLLPDRTKSGKRKSSVHKQTLDPNFNEKFSFGPLLLTDFATNSNRILWLSVWHKDRLTRNEFLGQVFIPLAELGQQLLSSDLCQSTEPKWYQLRDELKQLLDPAKQGQQQQAESNLRLAADQQAGQKQPTKTKSASNGSNRKTPVTRVSADANSKLVASNGRSQAAPDVARNQRLDEFQRKADFLAATRTPSVDLSQRQNVMNVSLAPIQDASKTTGKASQPITGQLFVALKFVPDDESILTYTSRLARAEGNLHVMVKEARNIAGFEQPTSGTLSLKNALDDDRHPQMAAPPSGPLPNPVCKCYLLSSNGQRISKQKTSQLKRTANPRWNQECIFEGLRLANLHSQAVELHLINRDSILVSSSSEFLGGIRLCSLATDTQQQLPLSDESHIKTISRQTASDEVQDDQLCSERESRLWNQMLQRPNIWVYGELKLHQLRALVCSSSSANGADK